MENLQLFKNENFGEIRAVLKEGEPWFVAKDVCGALELTDVSKSVARLDEDEKGTNSITTLGGQQEMLTINEYGLYNLVLGSRKPEAKQFKRWITHKVIPSIRKTGSYTVKQDLSLQLQVLVNLELQQKEQEKQLALVNEKVDNIKEIVALRPTNWREDTTNLINLMVAKGSSKEKRAEIRSESYKLLESRFGIDLHKRVLYKKQRMRYNGNSKLSVDKINNLDVIEDDKKLIEGYISVIKDMSIKYNVVLED